MVRIIMLTLILLFLRVQIAPMYKEYMASYWWVQAQRVKIDMEQLHIEKAKLCFNYGWCEDAFAPKPIPEKKDEDT